MNTVVNTTVTKCGACILLVSAIPRKPRAKGWRELSHVKPAESALAATNVRSRQVPSRGPGLATVSSSKVGWGSIRSVARNNFRMLRRQQRRRQQRRRPPPLHGVRPRHGKHRRDRRLRDERQRGQRQRAHRDMRTHQLKSRQCTRYRR
jgi:hypothetical protein